MAILAQRTQAALKIVSLTDVLIAVNLANERLLKRAAHSIPFVLRANHLVVFKRARDNWKPSY
jgi:hypothetical protein